MTDPNSVKCFVCTKHPQYQCPRCFIHYCSLDCYRDKKHEECSEAFYKEQVMSELKTMKGSSEDKRKMMKLLQQQQVQQSRDDDLGQRLAGIHLDDHEQLWENLSEHEKYVFSERLRTGNVDFIHLLKPWWQGNARASSIPSVFKDIESSASLLKGKTPNSSVKFSIVEVLLTYTCVMRLFNGDLYDSPAEVAEFMYKLSNVLAEDRVYSDIETVFYVFMQNHQEKLRLSPESVEECILIDLKCFANPKIVNITCAMCDLHARVKKIRKLLKETPMRALLYKTIKKLYFLAVYCHEHEASIKQSCDLLFELFQVREREQEQFQDQKKDIEQHKRLLQPKPKALIEEI